MVSWKDLRRSGVRGKQRAAIPEISRHNPAAPGTAQRPESEGRRGLEEEREQGTCKVSLCCRATRPQPGSQEAFLDSGLHKQAKPASFLTGLSRQKMALLLFSSKFQTSPRAFAPPTGPSRPCQPLPGIAGSSAASFLT